MLQRMAVRNFKLHKNTEIELKPITLFVGPNNSGKSSLFHILQLAKQGAVSERAFLVQQMPDLQASLSLSELPYIDVGTFHDVCSPGEDSITLVLKGFFAPTNLAMIKRKIDRVDVLCEFTFQDNRLIYHGGEVTAREYAVKWEWDQYSGGKITPEFLHSNGFTIKFEMREEFHRLLSPVISGAPPGTPRETQAEVRTLADGIAQAPSDLISSVHFVYGLRGFEQGSYHLEERSPPRLEMVRLHDRSSVMANLIAYNRELEDKLSAWFEDILGVGLRSELIGKNKVTLGAKTKGSTPFVNEGLGPHQLLFMLIPIALAQPFETICMDDPEAHLHPKAQSDLVSLLLRIYQKEHNQYLIATHSEHILFGFLTALAKKEINKEEVALYYFENKEGTAEIQKVEIDEYGRVSGGLPGFFEHNIDKMLDYLTALGQ